MRGRGATTPGGFTSVDVEGQQVDRLLQSFIPRPSARPASTLCFATGAWTEISSGAEGAMRSIHCAFLNAPKDEHHDWLLRLDSSPATLGLAA